MYKQNDNEILIEFKDGGHYTHDRFTKVIELSYETGIITADLKQYNVTDGELIESTFDDIVKFELGGEVIEVQSIDGIATIDFTSEVAGEYTIKTINSNIQNDEVIINV